MVSSFSINLHFKCALTLSLQLNTANLKNYNPGSSDIMGSFTIDKTVGRAVTIHIDYGTTAHVNVLHLYKPDSSEQDFYDASSVGNIFLAELGDLAVCTMKEAYEL